jgi:hypothetical protein
MAMFARLINLCKPEVNDMIGFMDGISLSSECTLEQFKQNAMYSSHHSSTMVNNIFGYGPDGKVFLCAINFPGSWHDGSITTNILPFIRNNIGRYKTCVDQGFPRSGNATEILVGQLVEHKPRALLQICVHTFVYLTFTFRYDKPVNGVVKVCRNSKRQSFLS